MMRILVIEQSCRISSWTDLKRRRLRLFKERRSKKKKTTHKNNMSCDMRSAEYAELLIQ